MPFLSSNQQRQSTEVTVGYLTSARKTQRATQVVQHNTNEVSISQSHGQRYKLLYLHNIDKVTISCDKALHTATNKQSQIHSDPRQIHCTMFVSCSKIPWPHMHGSWFLSRTSLEVASRPPGLHPQIQIGLLSFNAINNTSVLQPPQPHHHNRFTALFLGPPR